MKLAIVLDHFGKGGVSMVLIDFLRALQNESIDITLFIGNYPGEKHMTVPMGIDAKPWSSKRSLKGLIKSHRYEEALDLVKNGAMAKLSRFNYNRRLVYEARQCENLNEDEFDCVIAYHMTATASTILALEKIKAKRKVLWLHLNKKYQKKDIAFFERIYSCADRIVCVSQGAQAVFDSQFPGLKDKSETIHNFYNIEAIRAKAAEPIDDMLTEKGVKIVSVGRVQADKGHDRIPEAVKRLKEDGIMVHWYIVGTGKLEGELQQQIKDLELEDRITLLGFKENPYPYIKACDIYVQTSLREGFCTATMEAKILGKPVVTTDVEGMREQFVNGEDGIIVDSSADGVYEGVKRMICEAGLREKISKNVLNENVSNAIPLSQTLKVLYGRRK